MQLLHMLLAREERIALKILVAQDHIAMDSSLN